MAMAELSLAPSQVSGVVPRVLLSERQHRLEAVAYCVALEHARIVGPSDRG
jgi:hypothetical protein